MAGVKIREMFALLGLEVDKKEFDDGERALENIKDLLKLVVTGATLAAGAMGFMTRGFVHQALDLDQWNRRTGESIERLDGLRIASGRLGVDAEKTFEAYSELADKITDVVKNVKKLEGSDSAEALKNLGFKSVKEFQNADGSIRPLPELVDEVLDRIGALDNQAVKTGISMQLFGDDTGLALAALDVRQLREFRDEAIALGLTMSREDVEAAKRFQAEFQGALTTMQAVINAGIRPMIAQLTSLARFTMQYVLANREIIKQRIGTVFGGLARMLVFLTLKTRDYLAVLSDFIDGMGGAMRVMRALAVLTAVYLAVQVGTVLVNAFNVATAAVRGFNVWMALLNGIMTLQALIVGTLAAVIFLAVDEMITSLQNGETVIDDFLNSDKVDPDDNVIIRSIRAIILEVALLTKMLESLTTAFSEGLFSDIGRQALKNAATANAFLFFGDRKQAARFLEGKPFFKPTFPGEAPFTATPLGSPGDTSPFTLPEAPSVPPLAGGGTNVTIRQGDINIDATGFGAEEIAEKARAVVQDENRRAIAEAARRLQGGGG